MSSNSAIPASRVAAMLADERALFTRRNPTSEALGRRAGEHFPGGVPLHWMRDWGTPFPLVVKEALGAELTDVDGNRYADFCLGDTGAMFGHAPQPVVDAIRNAVGHGLTAMLPSADVAEVGGLLAEMFSLPFWQTAQTASDANRAVIRWARGLTKRKKVLVCEGCYHGQVDDAFVTIRDGKTAIRPGLVGQVVDLTETSVCVPFNDIDAVEAALTSGEVALVLTEPALTNTAMVLPKPGFLEALAECCRRHGTLLALDETHTISTARGGYARAHGLKPDFLILGKPVAGGLPAAVYGFTEEVRAGMDRVDAERPGGYSGIGTTLSGNMLALAAMRATLEHVMTEANYALMLALAETLKDGLTAAIDGHDLPWSVAHVGARAEIVFSPEPLIDGRDAARSVDHKLERAIHLFLLNRGVIVAPFHNMTLVSPATRAEHVASLANTFSAALDVLTA